MANIGRSPFLQMLAFFLEPLFIARPSFGELLKAWGLSGDFSGPRKKRNTVSRYLGNLEKT